MYFSLKRFPWTEFALSSKSTIMKTIQCYQLIYFLLFKKNIEIYFMTYMYIIISFIDSRQSLYILIIESHISASHYIVIENLCKALQNWSFWYSRSSEKDSQGGGMYLFRENSIPWRLEIHTLSGIEDSRCSFLSLYGKEGIAYPLSGSKNTPASAGHN